MRVNENMHQPSKIGVLISVFPSHPRKFIPHQTHGPNFSNLDSAAKLRRIVQQGPVPLPQRPTLRPPFTLIGNCRGCGILQIWQRTQSTDGEIDCQDTPKTPTTASVVSEAPESAKAPSESNVTHADTPGKKITSMLHDAIIRSGGRAPEFSEGHQNLLSMQEVQEVVNQIWEAPRIEALQEYPRFFILPTDPCRTPPESYRFGVLPPPGGG